MTRRVLAVDDDHDVLFTLQAISGGDFELVTLDSGFKGLELLKREPFDLLLSTICPR